MQNEIVFRDKVVIGFGDETVRRSRARRFKAGEARIAKLLAGSRTVLKSGLDRATAEKYREVPRKAGARNSVAGLRETAQPASAPPPIDTSGLSVEEG